MPMKRAVFPGSFDPITTGHVDIVQRALPLFDEIVIAIGINSQKSTLFSPEQRIQWIKDVFKAEPKVKVSKYEGLTIEFCKSCKANYIIRGIRSSADFEYEKTIAHLNHSMAQEIETILILSRPELSSISSTIVREIIRAKGPAGKFLPIKIARHIEAAYK